LNILCQQVFKQVREAERAVGGYITQRHMPIYLTQRTLISEKSVCYELNSKAWCSYYRNYLALIKILIID